MYTDGDFSTAQFTGAPVTVRPFYGLGDAAHVIINQPCIVERDSYTPLPRGTAHPTLANVFLSEEINDTDALCDLMEFVRVYLNKPASRDDYETYNFSYWPIIKMVGIGQAPAREGGSRTVTSRLRRDYFRIGSGLDYNTPADIPIIQRFIPVYTPPGDTVVLEAWWVGEIMAGTGTSVTVPDAAGFIALGEIVAEASETEHYRGDVWVRTTRYVPVGEMPS